METFVSAARRAALAGGEVIRGHLNARLTIEQKAHFDFGTDVDLKSEAAVRGVLAGAFPEHGFIGEETVYSSGRSEEEILASLKEDDYTWIVDALDGTTNFIRHIPQFVVSVALAKGKELIAGAIYDVSHDELFSAAAGEGAFMNGRPIRVTDTSDLDSALIGGSFPPASLTLRTPVIDAYARMAPHIGCVRVYNSCALSLCYVACGRLDACFEAGIHIWDMAAGCLIVREAGGVCEQCDGGPLTILSRDHFSGNPAVVRQLSPMFR